MEERLITAQELFDAGADGTLKEAWGTGTAAVISPIGEMGWEDQHVVVNGGKIGPWPSACMTPSPASSGYPARSLRLGGQALILRFFPFPHIISISETPCGAAS